MKKSLTNLIFTIAVLLTYSIFGFGQDHYNYSKQLIKHQSQNISKEDIFEFNQKIDTAELQNDTIEIIKCLINKGIINQLLSNYEESTNAYLNAIVLSSKINNLGLKGNCYLGLSNTYYRLANNNKSLDYAIQADKIFNEINDTANSITASLLMGQVLTDLREFKQSNAIYKKILNQAQLRNDSITLAEIYNHKGAIAFFQEDFENALLNYNKSLKINKALNNKVNVGINYANIGEVYMHLGDTEKALRYLSLAEKIEQKANYKSTNPFIYCVLAQTYSLLNKDEKAIYFYNKSIKTADDIGEIKEKSIIYLLLSEHHIKNKNYSHALNAYKNYIVENNKLDSLTNRLNINELKIKYDAEKKEKELLVMRAEKELQGEKISLNAKRIRLQNTIILLVILTLIISVGFLIYFIINQKKLREANHTKDILFSIIAHDLRGPMGTIKQIVHKLDESKEEERDRFIKVLKGPTEKAYDLLDDLLAWSLSINKKLANKPESLRLSKIVNEVFELLTPLANDKEIKCLNLIPDDVIVNADKNQISTVIRNLVLNAIKYNKIGESVEVYHSIEKNSVKIHVKDHGVGIDPQNIKKILSSKQFFTTYGTNDEKGSGLGLILAQNFIKNHGGKLEIRSKTNEGSIFSFSVRLKNNIKNNNL